MTRLGFDVYLDHIRRESARFREVLVDTDPAAGVPSCPDWTTADLLWHLTAVQHYWAEMLQRRPTGPDGYEDPERPTSYDDLLSLYDTTWRVFSDELESADPAEECWTWSSDHTVAFVYRRQAHEALIHRLDAELAAGRVSPLDPALAADGVQEALEVMFGGCPPWGTFTPSGETLDVVLTDTGDTVHVALGRFTGTDPRGATYDEPDIHVVAEPDARPVATVSGAAGLVDAWLWRRTHVDAVPDELSVAGDREVFDRFRGCVNHPIN